jgi:2'-hydroxyisoflavone reductase
MLVGAGDPYDRFGYWVRRIDQGGDMAAPGTPARPVQIIDVRDIANFVFLRHSGVFNMTGKAMPFLDMLNAIRKVSGSDARFHWVSDETIAALGIKGWTDLPLWLPESEVAFRHILNVDVSKAFANGLKTRPLEKTAEWVLQWDRSRRSTPLKSAVTSEIEKKLLVSNQ